LLLNGRTPARFLVGWVRETSRRVLARRLRHERLVNFTCDLELLCLVVRPICVAALVASARKMARTPARL